MVGRQRQEGPGVKVASLYAPVKIDESSIVGEHCVFGYPKEEQLRTEQRKPGSAATGKPVTVGADCLVGNHAVVHEGVQIAAGCVIEDRVRIGYDSAIGERIRVVYGAYRAGDTVRLADLLDEAVSRAYEDLSARAHRAGDMADDEITAIATAAGIGAVKYADRHQDQQRRGIRPPRRSGPGRARPDGRSSSRIRSRRRSRAPPGSGWRADRAASRTVAPAGEHPRPSYPTTVAHDWDMRR